MPPRPTPTHTPTHTHARPPPPCAPQEATSGEAAAQLAARLQALIQQAEGAGDPWQPYVCMSIAEEAKGGHMQADACARAPQA